MFISRWIQVLIVYSVIAVKKEPEKFVKPLEDKHVHEEDGQISFECVFCKPSGKLRWLVRFDLSVCSECLNIK